MKSAAMKNTSTKPDPRSARPWKRAAARTSPPGGAAAAPVGASPADAVGHTDNTGCIHFRKRGEEGRVAHLDHAAHPLRGSRSPIPAPSRWP